MGHRIVHGGERFHEAVRIDAEVEAAVRELADLAPLHQPKSLAAMDAVAAALPQLPAVACFDTAFHVTLPPQPPHTRCRRDGGSAGDFAASASTGSRTHGSRDARRSCSASPGAACGS